MVPKRVPVLVLKFEPSLLFYYKDRPKAMSSLWFMVWASGASYTGCTNSKVASFMKWIQWLLTVALAGDEVVLVNIDETPVYKQLQPRKGYVIRTETRNNRTCYARVPLRDRRGQSTLVGCVVNDPVLQSKMPQFLFTNDRLVNAAEKVELANLPEPIRWVKGSKGWNTAGAMTMLCTAYRKAIRSVRPNAQIVLFMDCATIHTAENVLMHCSRLGLHICLIPGGMTNLCQPLDTHVFALFKKTLADLQEMERGRHAFGMLSGTQWIEILRRCIWSTLVTRSWSSAFTDNGMDISLENLRPRIQQLLQVHMPMPPGPPDDRDVEMVLGRKRQNFTERVLRVSTRAAERKRILRLPASARLPSAGFAAAASSGAASSSSAALPPLPPPAEFPPPDAAPARFTRAGSRY